MNRHALELALIAAIAVSGYYGFKHWQAATPTSAGRAVDIKTTKTQVTDVNATPPQAAVLELATNPEFTTKDLDTMRLIHARFATGDFVTAIKLADAALRDPGYSKEFHHWIRAQHPVLLTSAGWARLKLGDCESAIGYLRRSEAIKRAPETAKGLAVCYYKEKTLVEAREQFAYYLDHSAPDPEIALLYADVLESEERYDEAVKILEQAATALPANTSDIFKTGLLQRLASMRARSKESSNQRLETSRNFRLLYRVGDHDDLVAFVLSTLEDALDEYLDAYGFKAPLSPFEVTLYPASDFATLVTGGPTWAEGIFDGRLRIPIRAEMLERQDYSSLKIVLRHELVHALFANMSDSRNIPPWFDEGMAQRLSCGLSGCGVFVIPANRANFSSANAFAVPYISLEPRQKAQMAYLQSLYLIYVLEYRHRDDSLRDLVRHIGKASDISSDGIMQPLGGMTFASLHSEAKSLWEQGIALGRQ